MKKHLAAMIIGALVFNAGLFAGIYAVPRAEAAPARTQAPNTDKERIVLRMTVAQIAAVAMFYGEEPGMGEVSRLISEACDFLEAPIH